MNIKIADECIDQIIVNECKAILQGRYCFGTNYEKMQLQDFAKLGLKLYGTAEDQRGD